MSKLMILRGTLTKVVCKNYCLCVQNTDHNAKSLIKVKVVHLHSCSLIFEYILNIYLMKSISLNCSCFVSTCINSINLSILDLV